MADILQNNNHQPIYNSRIIHTYTQLVKKKYPDVNVIDLLKYAGMTLYEVDDEGHWFTQDQINRFHERLVRVTGNENISREAGRYAASPGTIGFMRQYIIGLATPAKVYELIGKSSANLTRSCRYDSRVLAPNKVEVTVTPYEGTRESPFQCETRMGFFEAITMGFIQRIPKIEHPECMFRGGEVCRYIITWDQSPHTYFKLIRNYAALALLLLSLVLTAFYPLKVLFPYFALFAITLMGLSLAIDIFEKKI